MQSLASLFKEIKTSVGGNREVTKFEFSKGQPIEEKMGITPLNCWQKRIFGELEFALALNRSAEGKYENEIRNALDFLRARLDETGTISSADAMEAEQDLLPLQAASKEYKLLLCAHAHIDMNWMWSWQETVAITLDTFRTMLAIMREYPDFVFSQSQGSVYRIVEEFEPSMMEEIKQRIAEGRWEVTASAWVETDKNMPSTESLARHILYTKQYMRDTWGVDPASLEIDFSPDTFGHSAHLPELNNAGGVKYYYHCRGNNVTDPLYRWRAASGKEVLVYREAYWYNSGIKPFIGAGLPELSRRSGGFKTGLIVYGVGDHGGGPTRRDVEAAIDMQGWPIFPRVEFSTFRQFFHEAEAVRDALPIVEGEQNFIFAGCYTTQSRIKRGNRHSEDALAKAEMLGALSKSIIDTPYCPTAYGKAWRDVLFTHFHDILTGSCVQDTREHAMGLFSNSLAIANTQRSQSMRALAARIDTSALARKEDITLSQSEGAGVGYGIESFASPAAERGAGIRRLFHIFNDSTHPRKAVAELTVWDWTGDLQQIAFEDCSGAPLRHQLLQSERERYWDHMFFKVLVEVDLPAYGYTTVVMDEAEIESYPSYYLFESTEKPHENIVLENTHLRAEFCFQTGMLLSLVDKGTDEEMIGMPAGLKLVTCDGNGDSAWVIGRYMTEKMVMSDVVVRPLQFGGCLRNGLTLEAKVMSSTIKAVITLDSESNALKYDLTVDWHEISKQGQPVPTLVYSAPVSYEAEEYLYDVPAGSMRRPAMHIDVPALTYGAAIDPDGRSLALATDCKYGFRGADDTISVTLIHSTNNPDPYPERGIHHIQLVLFAQDACPVAMKASAQDALQAPSYISAQFGSGDLPTTKSLFSIEDGTTAVLSGVKWAEDGSGMIVRLYETAGKKTQAKLTFAGKAQSVTAVDLLENDCAGEAFIENGKVCVSIEANSIASAKVTL